VVAESAAQGAFLPRGVEACIHTLPESVVSLIPWRPRCSEEAAVPLSGQTAVKEALFQREGRLLYATTDWRSLCRPISSISAVWQLSTASYFVLRTRGTDSFAGSPRGEDGGEGELREQRLRAKGARCAEQRTGEATYARGRKCENTLELRGRAPAEFPGQAMHGALRAAGAREVGLCPDEIEHTGQQETALWARWGAHRERVDADA
jgi:hypothetical protein